MSGLRLKLLGGFELCSASGATVPLAARKPALLLAFLALQPGQRHSREKLAGLFWGDSGEAQARSSLRQALNVLRQHLRPYDDVLRTPDPDTIAIASDALVTDVAQFERCLGRSGREALEQAAALYGGELLDGHQPREPLLAEWLTAERQRLRERALAAMSALLERLMAEGPSETGIPLALRILAIDPLEEGAHRALMRLYAGLGRRGAALTQYETCRDLLRREAGVAPEAATQRLFLELRDRRDVPEAPRPPSAPPIAASPGPSPDRPNSAWTDPAPPTPIPGTPPAAAQRRQLTVMLCDLGGSDTATSELDPEALHGVLGVYQATVTAAVARFEGHLARIMADSAVAYFGWPLALEDAAERAVRAGLEIVAEMQRLCHAQGLPLPVRIGIATGIVVVGDLEGQAEKGAVIGPTPKLAARLQELAAPGEVLVAASTRRLLGELFELAPLDAIGSWRVIREAPAEGRFEARHAHGILELVDRKQELALLLDRWQLAKAGDGQIVELSGEPGIGKSRIALELRQQLRGEHLVDVRLQCSPYHTKSALWPVIRQMERAVGAGRDAPAETVRSRLEALLAASDPEAGGVVPLFAELLGLPADEEHPAPSFDPAQKKRRIFRALVAHLEAMARQRPLLVSLEDAQWLDPTTRELLDSMVESVAQLPILLVVTARPEALPLWSGHAHVTTLTLSRLVSRHVEALVQSVTGAKSLPAEIVEQIRLRTDGVPLFVEELTKALLESGLLRDAGNRLELVGALSPVAIPATLHDSLMARLDRLALVKEVAQVAACIGREFGHELLAAVVDLPGEELLGALDQLVAAQLVFRRGVAPSATYSFKHALVRDSAYTSLLKSRRQQIHGRIVRVLEERFADVAALQPEVMARHCSEAQLLEPSIVYWLRAGTQAMARSAMAEAVADLQQGLRQVAELPEGAARDRLELDLQVALAGALSAARGWAAEETGEALARARELCVRAGEVARLVPVILGQWSFHLNRVELGAARRVAEELLELAGRHDDLEARLLGHRLVGTTLLHVGRPRSARAHLEQALALYDSTRHRSLAFRYAHLDPRVAGLGFLSWALFFLGCPDEACARSDEARHEARALSHVGTEAFALYWAGCLAQLRGDHQAVLRDAEQLMALATEHGHPMTLALATVLRGWARMKGEGMRAVPPDAEDGLAAYRRTGAQLWVPYLLAVLAEMHERSGRAGDALNLLAEALAQVERTGERWFEAELHRRRGDVLLAIEPARTHEAETSYRKALDVAREQEAGMWELRAATALARLLRERGEAAEAHALLAGTHGAVADSSSIDDSRGAEARPSTRH